MNDIIIYNQRSGMLMFHKPFDTVFERDFGQLTATSFSQIFCTMGVQSGVNIGFL